MEHRRRQEGSDAVWKAVERGWRLGSKAFKAELLEQMRESRGDHYGPDLREADEVHAERLVQETTMTLKWIARRLQMGTWTCVSNCLVAKEKAR